MPFFAIACYLCVFDDLFLFTNFDPDLPES